MTFSFGDEERAQVGEAAGGRGLDGPGAHVERVGDLALGEVGVVAQDDALPFAHGELSQRGAEPVGEDDGLDRMNSPNDPSSRVDTDTPLWTNLRTGRP